MATTAVLEYGHRLRRYLRTRLKRERWHDIEDLAQEVYFRLLRYDENKLVQDPARYVLGIASNVVADYYYLHARRAHVSWDDADAELAGHDHRTEDSVDQLSLEQEIERAFSSLPERCAIALLLVKRDGLSYEQAAQKLGTTARMVSNYVVEAKKEIRLSIFETSASRSTRSR
ncbi:RNA polymerase sigma factor [Steroidobacter cummioxidans]|uniref:RNA polymerase sigma factor n=1 Tax=Steroidobacter cummioxidans TaxID=1803913 RepID=UPI00137B41F5|nr:sigma-70 family RNA polymerase sigma factor [Steroidobacter cummioxidans]